MTQEHNLWIKKAFMIIISLLILSTIVTALGVAPSRKVIDYSSDTQYITARIINNENRDMNLVLYAQGELADYVTLEKTTIKVLKSETEKEFKYSFKLPNDLSPGQHNINIILMEVPDKVEVSETPQTTILSTLSVAHQLRINVPYPGAFAEGILYISEGNVNDTITFTANVINKGVDTIHNINGELVIKGPTNEELARIKTGSIDSIASQQSEKLVANWVADANPGVYYAEFIINYNDQQFVLRKTFMVGNFLVDIQGIKVNNFRLGAIAKFDVDLLSKWNQPIQNVYGDLQIMDTQGNVLSTFKTLPIELRQLTTSTITGFWDTKDVKIGDYDVKVTVYYDGKTTEKVFKTVVGIDSIQVQDLGTIGNVIESPGKGNSLSLIYILVIISIILNIALFIYFKFMRKKQT